jgi:hypothetical protein
VVHTETGRPRPLFELDVIDAWAAKAGVSRSEAMRRLIEAGLKVKALSIR